MAKIRRWPGEPDGLWIVSRPSHLPRETRSVQDRLEALQVPVVLPYLRLARLQSEVLEHADRKRRIAHTGVMIAGPRSNGRSTAARKIVEDLGRGAWIMSMPTRAAFDDFWLALTEKRNHRLGFHLQSVARQFEAHDALRAEVKKGLKLIIVDGCENLLDVSTSRRRLMLHCIEKASAVGGVPIVLIGTPALASRILADEERVGNYEILLLPPW